MKDLKTLREEIDQYDREIVKYYEKRMEAVLQVLAYKREEKIPIFHEGREQQVLNKVVGLLENKSFKEETSLLYQEIMRISRKRQSKELFPHNISLVGFMGTGKSSISTNLSKMLEMEWYDTDMMIEKKMGISIGQIFENYGENKFREIETDTIREIVKGTPKIISCGGGVPLKEENITYLKNNGKVVLLEASPSSILSRLRNDDTRPLLRNNMTLDHIEKMLSQRREAYTKASDIAVSTDGKDTKEIALEVIDKLLSI